ncbi:MAG: winged helix-turn-helix transcriptional regulator [Candidatus Odinarchaeota archaeon]
MPENNYEEKISHQDKDIPEQHHDKEEERAVVTRVPFSRDIKVMTEVLILLELINNPRLKLKEIADKLGISKQAVSDYLKASMEEERLEKEEGSYRVTYKGVALLQSTLLETQDFVKDAMGKLPVFRQVTALAKTKIKKNEVVGLFMEDGMLTAYAERPSGSTGVSLYAAEKEEEVKIGSLEGVVDHKIASMILVKLPERSRHCNTDELVSLLKQHKNSKLAVLDLVSMVAIKKISTRADIQYAVVEASLEAVLKGIPVIVLGTENSMKKIEEAINNHNKNSQKKIPTIRTELIYDSR